MCRCQSGCWDFALLTDTRSARVMSRRQLDINREDRTPTYIILPREVWPARRFDNAGKLVCRLKKALCGHLESGAVWEKHLEDVLKGLRWQQCDGIASTWVRCTVRKSKTRRRCGL
eukprot:6419393-Amphidinium_carterae.1